MSMSTTIPHKCSINNEYKCSCRTCFFGWPINGNGHLNILLSAETAAVYVLESLELEDFPAVSSGAVYERWV